MFAKDVITSMFGVRPESRSGEWSPQKTPSLVVRAVPAQRCAFSNESVSELEG